MCSAHSAANVEDCVTYRVMLGKASQHLCGRAETGQTHAKMGRAIQEQRPVWDIKVWYVHG